MVTVRHPRTSDPFGAIADPNRRRILDMLRAGEQRATELAERFPISRPAISRHVRVLRRAGLLRVRCEGPARVYSLHPQALADVDRWLQPYRLFWAARLMDPKLLVETSTPDVSSVEPRERV
jgi:DNA-binding transcriptional ArsR family regulator